MDCRVPCGRAPAMEVEDAHGSVDEEALNVSSGAEASLCEPSVPFPWAPVRAGYADVDDGGGE